MKGYKFTRIESYDFHSHRASHTGIVRQWRVEREDGYLVGVEDTKKEALELARWDKKMQKRMERA